MDTQFFLLKIKVAVANQTNGNSSCFFIPVLDHYENTDNHHPEYKKIFSFADWQNPKKTIIITVRK